jgi:hypothetical protein
MRRRANCSNRRFFWLLALVAAVTAGLALAEPAGATSTRHVGRPTPVHIGFSGLAAPAVYSHSFLGLGPLSGEVLPAAHAPKGLAIGWHRRHDRGTPTPPVFDPPGTPVGDMMGDMTGDMTGDTSGPAIPEPSAALLFGAGSLLVASALRKRKAAA